MKKLSFLAVVFVIGLVVFVNSPAGRSVANYLAAHPVSTSGLKTPWYCSANPGKC